MKNLKIQLLLVVVLLMASCQGDYDVMEGNDVTTIEKRGLNRTTNDPENVDGQERFEGNLQWVSFITAEVLDTYPSANLEFVNAFNAGSSNSIRLSTVLGDNSQTNVFHDKFIEVLSQYYRPGRPETSLPSNPGSTGPTSSVEPTSDELEDFVNYLINENCIELYLPNGIVVNGFGNQNPVISSTAHPLTNQSWNYGYERDNGTIRDLDIYSSYGVTLIVARPYRSVLTGDPAECAYTEYNSVSDFTNFLD